MTREYKKGRACDSSPGFIAIQSQVSTAYRKALVGYTCIEVRADHKGFESTYYLYRDNKLLVSGNGWASFEGKVKAFLKGMKEATSGE